MDTKQKLTLGIAAIFMVTLTIVGVTYAYFVTRVIGETTESVNVSTATLASVSYGDGNQIVKLENVLPGSKVYKTFTVTNDATEGNAASYDIFLTSTVRANTAQFVHADDDSMCYVSTAKPSNDAVPTTDCFDASVYNNVKVTLKEVTTLTGSEDQAALATAFGSGSVVYATQGLVNTAQAAEAVQVLAQNQLVYPVVSGNNKKVRYYILEVHYENNEKNQNIENLAAVDIKVDIR